MTISLTKSYTTRSGLPVRIYAVDGGGNYPVHGASFADGKWQYRAWPTNGRLSLYTENGEDLYEVKPRIKRTVWLNVYHRDLFRVYSSPEEARLYGSPMTLAVAVRVDIDCEEGFGVTQIAAQGAGT